jgi:hypothetical protein
VLGKGQPIAFGVPACQRVFDVERKAQALARAEINATNTQHVAAQAGKGQALCLRLHRRDRCLDDQLDRLHLRPFPGCKSRLRRPRWAQRRKCARCQLAQQPWFEE